MKARDDFTLLVDKDGNRVFQPYTEIPKGLKQLKFKKGDEVPKEYIGDLLTLNQEYLDIQYKDGVPILPDGIVATKKKPRSEYQFTRDELTEKLNVMGFTKFRDWSKKKFGLTDVSGSKLITEIIKKQEDDFQKGE